jgi:hypothetical protein
MGVLPGHDPKNDRRIEHDRSQGVHPDKATGGCRALGEEIPCCVGDRGEQDRDERERGHLSDATVTERDEVSCKRDRFVRLLNEARFHRQARPPSSR